MKQLRRVQITPWTRVFAGNKWQLAALRPQLLKKKYVGITAWAVRAAILPGGADGFTPPSIDWSGNYWQPGFIDQMDLRGATLPGSPRQGAIFLRGPFGTPHGCTRWSRQFKRGAK